MGDYCKCKWCGKTFEKSGFSKFKSGWTMGIAGKEDYCSKRCETEANAVSGNTQVGANQSQTGGSFLGGILSSDDKEDARLAAEQEARKDKIEARVDSIISIQFGTTSDEISNALNQLVTIAAGKPDKEVKKAIYEKMEFAIMKLRQLGATVESDFFEKKRADIKPKWYD